MKNKIRNLLAGLDARLHLRRQLETGSVWKNVLAAFLLLVILPTGIMLSWYYHKSAAAVERDMAETIYKAVEQAAQHIDLRLESVREISDNIFMNSMFGDAFSKTGPRGISEQVSEQEELGRNLEIFQRREDVQRIRLYFKTPNFYTNEHVNFFAYSELRDEPWLAEMERNNGAVTWIGARKQTYSDGTEERVLTCARLMKRTGDISAVTGALLIDVKYENIYRILEETRISDQEQIFLFNESGTRMLGGTEASGTEGRQDRLLTMGEGVEKEKGQYYMVREMPRSGWRIGVVLPEQAVTATGAENNRFFNVILLAMIFVLFMLVFFGMFGYLMMRVNWRIKRIVQKLEREGIENIGAREPAEQSEVYQLENHIDRMIAKAKDLMQETFAARLEKQEAELRSLQAQINPHFLYNTLDNISWMAVRANAPDICGMIQTLSQYFRLSLSGGKDIVTVEDELELARVYIEIQNSRFRGIIAADIEVPASMRACSIPKLTLQPLLENAVIHGLQPKDDKAWRLRIRGEEQGDTLLFYVEDNGVGMTEEKVESLLRFQPGPGGHGYGLYNVNKRLQLYCGEAFGLRIQSWPGRGTRVCAALSRLEDRPDGGSGQTDLQ